MTGKMAGKEELRNTLLEPFLNFPLLLPLPWPWETRSNLCPGPHLGIVDVVGATVLSKPAERLKPGGIREVGADST